MPPRTLARRQAQVVAVFLAVLAAWYGTHDYRYAEDLHHSAGERRSASSICEGLDGPLTGTGPSLAMLATLKDSDPQSEASIRQRNALRSWRAVFPDAALYFAGAAPADLTSELGAVRGPRSPRCPPPRRALLASNPYARSSCTRYGPRLRERRC